MGLWVSVDSHCDGGCPGFYSPTWIHTWTSQLFQASAEWLLCACVVLASLPPMLGTAEPVLSCHLSLEGPVFFCLSGYLVAHNLRRLLVSNELRFCHLSRFRLLKGVTFSSSLLCPRWKQKLIYWKWKEILCLLSKEWGLKASHLWAYRRPSLSMRFPLTYIPGTARPPATLGITGAFHEGRIRANCKQKLPECHPLTASPTPRLPKAPL